MKLGCCSNTLADASLVELSEGRAPSTFTSWGIQMFVNQRCLGLSYCWNPSTLCHFSHHNWAEHPRQGNSSPAAKCELTAQWKQKSEFSSFVCFVFSQKLPSVLLLDLQEKSWDSKTAEYTGAVPRCPQPVPKQILELSNPCARGLVGLSCSQELTGAHNLCSLSRCHQQTPWI